MIFKGRYCLITNTQKVDEVSLEYVEQAIENLALQDEGYVSLFPMQEKKKYEYLKVFKEKTERDVFVLETCLKTMEGMKTPRCRTKMKDTIMKAFFYFHSFQVVNDVGEWEDISPSEFELQINGKIIGNVNFDKIREGIIGLRQDPQGYVILSTNEAIEGSTFMQVAYPEPEYDDGRGYIIEFNKQYEGEYKIYRYRTKKQIETLNIIKDYFISRKISDIVMWEDVTAELM